MAARYAETIPTLDVEAEPYPDVPTSNDSADHPSELRILRLATLATVGRLRTFRGRRARLLGTRHPGVPDAAEQRPVSGSAVPSVCDHRGGCVARTVAPLRRPGPPLNGGHCKRRVWPGYSPGQKKADAGVAPWTTATGRYGLRYYRNRG